MTSKEKQVTVFSLQAKPSTNYEENYTKLSLALRKCQDASIIVASEVFLTGFDYEEMEQAAQFGQEALKRLLLEVVNQIVVFTLIVKTEKGFVNQAVVLHDHKIVYSQDKAKLFHLGDEHRYFIASRSQEIKPFVLNGVRYAILICFELRFKELWRQIEGADVVIIPAKWGVARQEHFIILAHALAVMNQCFVVICSDGGGEIANISMVINPNGEIIQHELANGIQAILNLREVAMMRRYIAMEK